MSPANPALIPLCSWGRVLSAASVLLHTRVSQTLLGFTWSASMSNSWIFSSERSFPAPSLQRHAAVEALGAPWRKSLLLSACFCLMEVVREIPRFKVGCCCSDHLGNPALCGHRHGYWDSTRYYNHTTLIFTVQHSTTIIYYTILIYHIAQHCLSFSFVSSFRYLCNDPVSSFRYFRYLCNDPGTISECKSDTAVLYMYAKHIDKSYRREANSNVLFPAPLVCIWDNRKWIFSHFDASSAFKLTSMHACE